MTPEPLTEIKRRTASGYYEEKDIASAIAWLKSNIKNTFIHSDHAPEDEDIFDILTMIDAAFPDITGGKK